MSKAAFKFFELGGRLFSANIVVSISPVDEWSVKAQLDQAEYVAKHGGTAGVSPELKAAASDPESYTCVRTLGGEFLVCEPYAKVRELFASMQLIVDPSKPWEEA